MMREQAVGDMREGDLTSPETEDQLIAGVVGELPQGYKLGRASPTLSPKWWCGQGKETLLSTPPLAPHHLQQVGDLDMGS